MRSPGTELPFAFLCVADEASSSVRGGGAIESRFAIGSALDAN
jgi:hypothetical protein